LTLALALTLQLSLEIGLRLQLVLLLVLILVLVVLGVVLLLWLTHDELLRLEHRGRNEIADLLSLRSSKRGGALCVGSSDCRRLRFIADAGLVRMPPYVRQQHARIRCSAVSCDINH
jgi:hypothetical protein